jgi:hypothetical protein
MKTVMMSEDMCLAIVAVKLKNDRVFSDLSLEHIIESKVVQQNVRQFYSILLLYRH